MTRAEIDLHNRVERLESALLKLCAATMDLVLVVDENPQKGGLYRPTQDERNTAVKKAVGRLREAVEIVSGEHAPRE